MRVLGWSCSLALVACATPEVVFAPPVVPPEPPPPPAPVASPDPTPLWETEPTPPLPSAVDIEHARRVGNADLFDRPPPPDPEKVLRALLDTQVLLDTQQIPPWTGSRHRLPIPEDRLAAILAVPDHPAILVALARDPTSRIRGQAAALAALLQIEAAIPALLAILDAPIPSRPWQAVGQPHEIPAASKAELEGYVDALASWRLAIAGVSLFERRELYPRLAAILFDPPAWFVAPNQPDLLRDTDEVRRAREAVYRTLVRGGGPAEWSALRTFEERTIAADAAAAPVAPGGDDVHLVAAPIARYFRTIDGEHRFSLSPSDIDQVAVRGERARARIEVQTGRTVSAYRVSLRRQDGIWRVEDYWRTKSR
jgi:hypothetical protein